MIRSRNVYISHTRRCRRNYDQLKTEQLLSARCDNASVAFSGSFIILMPN